MRNFDVHDWMSDFINRMSENRNTEKARSVRFTGTISHGDRNHPGILLAR